MIDLEQLAATGGLFDGHYKLLRALSTDGATADVWLARDVNTIDMDFGEEEKDCLEETGMLVAIKIYRPKNALDIEGEQRFRDEFKIVYECRHANLLQPTSFSIYEGNPYLVLPYCGKGSSEQLIGKPLNEQEIWKYIQDVAAGLNRLHTNTPQIVHQDIKPANILLDNNGNYAITDFGISSKRGGIHGYYFEEENSGTMAYMAPERFVSGADPMPESDIWALGATLCEILTGKVPFGEEGGADQVEKKLPMPALHGVPASVQRLVYACLDKEPGNRPSAHQILVAARARQFPPKKRTGLYVALAVVLVLLAAWGVWTMSPYRFEYEYAKAEEALKADDPKMFRAGYDQMLKLCKQDYVPAMFDMASIHGWNPSEEAIRQKKMLGIVINEKGISVAAGDNINAVGWLESILNKADPSFAYINMKAAYQLAGYYLIENDFIQQNDKIGAEYLKQSLAWAKQAQEDEWVENIQKSLVTLNELTSTEK